MANDSIRGFVWYDLMTHDVEGAKAFYGDIIGWKATKWPGGDYWMLSIGDKSYAGLMAHDEAARKAGSPPMWLGYVGVRNVDATAQRAKSLGGKVLAEPRDIPDVGRFAVLADPQGAVFAIFSPKPGAGPDGVQNPNDVGNFSWAELNTTDWKAAWKFYSNLFGWKPTQSMDMGPEYGEYYMFGTSPEKSFGGMSNTAKMLKAPPHWLHYIRVTNVDETVKRIPQKGGKIVNGPMDVPGGDRVAQCVDPQGGSFAIVSSAAKK
ncbi:MAG: VOC family protein [Myxococcaceae bacterium]|nr:VOC family protein [Myxococcaceae bacterium]